MDKYESIVVIFKNGLFGLSDKVIKKSLADSLSEYKMIIFEGVQADKGNGNWFMLHDLLASFYGYYGDLDIYWDDYVKSLVKLTSKKRVAFRAEIEKALEFYIENSRYIESLKARGIEII
jgi:hypothetical protein